MKKIKDIDKINRALENGDVTFVDTESGYKYSLYAACPNDSYECSVASFEREGGEVSTIMGVTFYCPICNNRFNALPESMFLR